MTASPGPVSQRAPRGLAVLVLSGFFFAAATSDFWQATQSLGPTSMEPRLLGLEHALVGIVNVAAAIAIWRRSRAAAPLIWLWGLLDGMLLATLPEVLGMAPEARPGLWSAGAFLFLVALAIGFYVRRRISA